MPLSVVRRLSLGELTPTTVSLQMEDRSMTQLEGILEDVLVKVGKFIFLVDFMVIDIEEDKKIPLFLGRPFLDTGATLIDVKKGELTLRVGKEEVHFNLNQSLKQPDFEKGQCMRIDNLIPVSKEQNDSCMNQDPLEKCLLNSLNKENLDWKNLNASEELMEIVLSLNERSADDLSSEKKVQEAEKSFEGLKEFPKHLKYVFLGEEKSKPVIIATYLITKKKEKVKEIL